MTCFWDGIIKGLIYKKMVNPNIRQIEFITLLKQKVIKPERVTWNEQKITDKQFLEFKEWIHDYDISKISQGHLCSIWDPFLILICELFTVNIHHNYNGTFIKYTNSHNTNYNTLYFQSDKGHFWVHLK